MTSHTVSHTSVGVAGVKCVTSNPPLPLSPHLPLAPSPPPFSSARSLTKNGLQCRFFMINISFALTCTVMHCPGGALATAKLGRSGCCAQRPTAGGLGPHPGTPQSIYQSACVKVATCWGVCDVTHLWPQVALRGV